MSYNMTDQEFAQKVAWEGGVLDALEYGLKRSDLTDQDGRLAIAWASLSAKWDALQHDLVTVERLIEELTDE